jgi:hypothetical protein
MWVQSPFSISPMPPQGKIKQLMVPGVEQASP